MGIFNHREVYLTLIRWYKIALIDTVHNTDSTEIGMLIF